MGMDTRRSATLAGVPMKHLSLITVRFKLWQGEYGTNLSLAHIPELRPHSGMTSRSEAPNRRTRTSQSS